MLSPASFHLSSFSACVLSSFQRRTALHMYRWRETLTEICFDFIIQVLVLFIYDTDPLYLHRGPCWNPELIHSCGEENYLLHCSLVCGYPAAPSTQSEDGLTAPRRRITAHPHAYSPPCGTNMSLAAQKWHNTAAVRCCLNTALLELSTQIIGLMKTPI